MESNEVQEARPATQEMSAIEKIIGVFTSPGKTFQSIDQKPSWVLPVAVAVLVSVIFVFTTQSIIVNEAITKQQEKMEERGMDADQIDQSLAMMEKGMKFSVPAFSVLGPVLVILIVAGIFFFVGNVVLGGMAPYKKVLAVTAFSWLIFSLGSLIALPIVLSRESIEVSFSLATLMSEEAQQTFLYKFLSKLDVFSIWWVAVQSIGLAVIYKMKTQKMATAVVAVFLIYAVVGSALASMF
ncbi:MAG: Yip1 family protein [bacterium]